MTDDVPTGALSAEAILDWLPERRLPLSAVGAVVDQDVERVSIQAGVITGDDDGEWLTSLYVTDTDYELMHAVGWDLDGGEWVVIGTWEGDEYDPDDARASVVEWTESHYPDSAFSRPSRSD